MGNILLKVVKIGVTSTALYFGGKACKFYGYIKGYSDASESIFDALDMEDEDQKKETLIKHSEIAQTWKEMKSNFREIKNTIKK